MSSSPRAASVPARRGLPIAALALTAALFLGGCTFDYSDAQVEPADDGPIPQVEILDVRMVIERDNSLELTASRIASYPDEGYQTFTDLVFREYGPDGRLRLEGRADAGTLYLDTENVELHGDVRFYSTIEEAALESRFLSWDAEEKTLTGGDGQEVTVTRDDGSGVRGHGFAVDGRRNAVIFSEGVNGVFQSGEDE